ncbi:hypothetical protein MRX96_027593 [Rhipicephalus microplus]
MSSAKSLDAADCTVFGVLTALGYAAGLYSSITHRRSQVGKTHESEQATLEAFLGGRTLPEAALTVSMLASVANGVTIIGFLAHFYAHGFHIFWGMSGVPLAIIITSVALVPTLYDMRMASIFQYLRMRFNSKVGITACVVYFVLSIVPYYLRERLSDVTLLRGLFLAGLLGASTSTGKRHHNDHLRHRCTTFRHCYQVVGKLEKYGIKLNVQKLRFFLPEDEYLGHIVNKEGLFPNML